MAEKQCSVENCTNPSRARGWCKPHYERWRTTGSVHSDVPLKKWHAIEQRSRNIHKHMIARCHNPKNKYYDNYGGRGIQVCDRWRFGDGIKTGSQCFVEDMGNCPEGLMIDRINNDEGYSPGNCRWVNRHEQNQNRRYVHNYTHNGEKHCIAAWAKKLGIHRGTLRNRLLVQQLPFEKAIR